MKKFPVSLLCFVAALWMWGCNGNKDHATDCDNTINNWNHFITRDSVQVMVSRLAAFKMEKNIDAAMVAQSYLFGSAKEMMRNMMLRDSCTGIRVYYGLNASNRIIPIVCGVNKQGGDIYWIKRNEKGLKGNTGNDEEGLCDMSTEEPPPPVSGPYIHP